MIFKYGYILQWSSNNMMTIPIGTFYAYLKCMNFRCNAYPNNDTLLQNYCLSFLYIAYCQLIGEQKCIIIVMTGSRMLLR